MATILIACSHLGELERIADIMALDGHICLRCPDGQAVRETLKESRPDLVITDVDLPGLDAFDLVRLLEDVSNGQGIPLIIGHAGIDTDVPSTPQPGFFWMGHATSSDDLAEIVKTRLEMGVQERVSGHILIVDDDKELRELVSRRLQMAGYRTSVAFDGEDGLVSMEQNPDLVLTDVDMPRLDGFGFLAQLRALPQYRQVPVIIMTAHAGRGEDAARGLQLGANDYVRKPFHWEELLARVHTQLRVREAHRLTVEKQRDLAVIELAGAAAHEINNPLAVVMARLELMLERLDSSNSVYEDVVKLNHLLERIADIVKKMSHVRRYQVRHYCGGVNIVDLDGASED
ncbi:MAG: response regulator [Candidatus Latescibacteria bacterium]|nr:response regulator [Candidatus Latescibacterota bacterium]MBT4137689.1 response regulator [Candidatus Latescibacterota bacterium]